MLFAGTALGQALAGGARAQEGAGAGAAGGADAGALAGAGAPEGSRGAAAAEADSSAAAPPIPGFTPYDIVTSGGVTIHAVKGGEGPPVLLLHGAPLTHYTWRDVAPRLAEEFTVVAADLRGYGDSSKPQGLPDHSNYSKRASALDQIEVMRHFGFDRFALVGQDRGGRVGHRMALDHPDAVTKAIFIDIVPTRYLYTHVTLDFVQAYFHWFSFLQPYPIPENMLLEQAAARARNAGSPARAEYQRKNGTPEGVHGMCEDYRASASIDLEHDEADLDRRIRCPLHVLWAEGGSMDRLYDVLAIWRERGTNVTGKAMPGGHNMQEGAPDEVLAELRAFLRA
ncbi:MAG: alpha/beta hydrolase [Gammaproteobacteria bacterium]|nr:alpha/beta hydrolase [Gammaproteobacteria bacterium]